MEQQRRVFFTRHRVHQILRAQDHQLGQLRPSVSITFSPSLGEAMTVPADPLLGLTPDEARAVLLSGPELDRPTVLTELAAARHHLADPSPAPPETAESVRAADVLNRLLPAESPDHPPGTAWTHPSMSAARFMSYSQHPERAEHSPEDFSHREALDAFDSAVESADDLACCSECATVYFYEIHKQKLEALATLAMILEAIEIKAERDRQFNEELHAALGTSWVNPQAGAPLTVG